MAFETSTILLLVFAHLSPRSVELIHTSNEQLSCRNGLLVSRDVLRLCGTMNVSSKFNTMSMKQRGANLLGTHARYTLVGTFAGTRLVPISSSRSDQTRDDGQDGTNGE